MRGNEFLDKMELVDSAYIEAADAMPQKQKTVRLRWIGAAACLAIMTYAGVRLALPKVPDTLPRLPLLTISEDTSPAMGFEGYLAYDISELINANPWNENSGITVLPVYKNPLTYDENYIATGADFEKMREFLLEIADRLGLDTGTLTITDDEPDEETKKEITRKFQSDGSAVPEGYFRPTKLLSGTDDVEVVVLQSMTSTISFTHAMPLPNECRFTRNASYEEMCSAAEYLKIEYSSLLSMKNPQINIYGGDYNIYHQQGYQIAFFDAGGSDVEQIINYNFYQTAFYCDEKGNLFLIRIYRPDLSEPVGEYPIITLKEAKKLLSDGNYLTTVPYEMPGMEYVKKAELVYRTGERENYFMPYYRFYVEIPELEEDGLKTFGAYYVPAVDGAYIENMPVW